MRRAVRVGGSREHNHYRRATEPLTLKLSSQLILWFVVAASGEMSAGVTIFRARLRPSSSVRREPDLVRHGALVTDGSWWNSWW